MKLTPAQKQAAYRERLATLLDRLRVLWRLRWKRDHPDTGPWGGPWGPGHLDEITDMVDVLIEEEELFRASRERIAALLEESEALRSGNVASPIGEVTFPNTREVTFDVGPSSETDEENKP